MSTDTTMAADKTDRPADIQDLNMAASLLEDQAGALKRRHNAHSQEGVGILNGLARRLRLLAAAREAEARRGLSNIGMCVCCDLKRELVIQWAGRGVCMFCRDAALRQKYGMPLEFSPTPTIGEKVTEK